MSLDRRKQIIDAAAKSFALFGYKATTMDQIAKIAQVGKGTIYTFFANKEELFNEILQQVILEMKHIADRESAEQRPFHEKVFRILDQALEFRSRHELAMKLSQELRDVGTPMAKEALNRLESELLTYIEAQLQSAMDRGELAQGDPRIMSFIMYQLYRSLTTEWNKIYDPLDKDTIKETFYKYFMKGILRVTPYESKDE
ncbi:TetR/AcrR family transcriptional regulator [Paenibacillus arenosi]|uniref:TetR/AcrR family transcriptional regulator n=1 Tax=Paenibacillus arenosi TaxID=2774142 RepID=A0ABR9AW44_9BACL|nr:TetR/AcrR family transcriptional regulator [Paenibacillus arenosi]MBD8498347.1 TetR/AcrR family transcriptional regulator [Paenibacillus arenosi]